MRKLEGQAENGARRRLGHTRFCKLYFNRHSVGVPVVEIPCGRRLVCAVYGMDFAKELGAALGTLPSWVTVGFRQTMDICFTIVQLVFQLGNVNRHTAQYDRNPPRVTPRTGKRLGC